MSVAGMGMLISHFLPSGGSHHGKNKSHEVKSDFQELSQDLQSGNLTQAQQDFATLSQNIPANQSPSNPMVQDLNAIGKDLKAGDLSAAQKDFATLQQDIKQAWAQGSSAQLYGQSSPHTTSLLGSGTVSKDLEALTQAVQGGSISSAQQAYSSLQADFQQFLSNSGSGSSFGSNGSTSTAPNGVNVTV
jgi:hypothetical protein